MLHIFHVFNYKTRFRIIIFSRERLKRQVGIMNGIVVMDCVQTAYQGKYGIYGARDRMIRISGRRAAAATGTRSFSHEIPADRMSPIGNESGLDGSDLKRSGSKKLVQKKAGRKDGRSKIKEMNHIETVTAAEKAKANSVHSDIRTGTFSPARREKKSSSLPGAVRLLVLAIVLTAMITGFHMITRASGRPRQQAWKYHTTVTIPYGESFGDLVERTFNSTYYASQDDYLKEICEINSLPYYKGEIPQLQSGTSLVIPYYSTEYK